MTGTGVHLTDLLISSFGQVGAAQAVMEGRSPRWDTSDVATIQPGFEAGMPATPSAKLHTPGFIRMRTLGRKQWIRKPP